MEKLVVCKNLKKSYGSKIVLKGMDLEIDRGQIVGLLGPNGSGKTTLIKTMAGLLHHEGGEVLIDGKEVGIETKKIVSYLPERACLDSNMRVRDAIAFFADFYEDFVSATAQAMIEKLDISVDAKIKTLSKGTREKVQLVLVMSRQAQLYLLDEPIGGVDPAARDYILRTILTNYNEGASVLISTHLISDVEQILDDIIFIKQGEMVLHETADALREKNGKSVDELFREVFAC